MQKEINKYLVQPGITVKEAMKQLDSSHGKVLFLADSDKKLLGSLTDGDIRRWILSGGSLNSNVESACHLKPFTVLNGYDNDSVKKEILKGKFSAVPVLDFEGRILNIIFWDELFEEEDIKRKDKKLECYVMIMAGGKGTRLEPFTKILPKPLIPIGDKAIIELIIDKFLDYSVGHFFVSINHKAKIIKSYFEELAPGYSIEYIEETKQLGTIGALAFLKGKLEKPVLVTNCDIIIDTDYSELLDFHVKNNYDISLVASVMHHKIPYGICEIENGGTLSKFSEKPEYSFMASTGMYIINPGIIDLIPENTFYHITHLIEKVRNYSGKVGVFPISENSWLDTGEWHEYKKTLERLKI
ncbi:MAG: NTP transferase domain-containing protein [Ignavibacteria bacterium]|nr:NTP transferase domain-containing protein [Ignavibacteria bacterium]